MRRGHEIGERSGWSGDRQIAWLLLARAWPEALIAEFLFSSGHAADLALVVIAVEAVVLWRMRRPDGLSRLVDVWPFLASGAALLLALRASLVGAPWWCVAAALAASGAFHAIDLARRLRP